jgi:ATP phosphoribosyltransferase regulatory subunit
MGKYSNVIPDGACDLLFKECEARRAVEKSMVDIFKSRGFSEAATPSLEFYDVFSGNSSIMDDEMMYKLIDARGRILVLRPDNTTPMARIASTKLKGFLPPLRLCYNQNVFRISQYMSGRYDELAQCGIELIGVRGEKADIEVILTAISALKSVLGSDFRFEIGHVGFYKCIIDELPFGDDVKERIRSLIASKSYASLNTMLEPYARDNAACLALTELPRLFGGREVLDRAFSVAPNEASKQTVKYLQTLYNTLCNMGFESNIMLDLGLVQQIEYYTDVVFKGYMHGTGEPVLSGGRYDGLFARFGADIPATGFAVNADAIARAIGERSKSNRPDVLIFFEKDAKSAFEHMETLIASGLICEMSVFETLDETQKYVAAKGIERIDIIDGASKTQEN